MSKGKKDLDESMPDQLNGKQLAEAGLSSVMLNTMTSKIFAQNIVGEMDFFEALTVVIEKSRAITKNDTRELEVTLSAQIGSLDAIFNEMARKAYINMGTHLQATETYMRLALKAQAQCARTIEVLTNIKNPPIVYARQANFANGHQQVNNNVNHAEIPRTHVENGNQQNELLSGRINETVDTRGAATPSGDDQQMETVGTKHRRKDHAGKSRVST